MRVALALDECGELLEVVLGLLRLAVAALGADERVLVVRDEHRAARPVALAVEDLAEVGVLR